MRDHTGYPYHPVAPRRSLTMTQDTRLRQQPASQHHAGHFAGLHPEDTPYSTSYGQEEDTAYTRLPGRVMPRSAIRYQIPPSERQPPRQRLHWLVWVGVALFVMIFGWVLLSIVGSWWQTTLDDWHYGRPRTFQTEANVGHYGYVSHFVALNLNGKIEVIETQPQNPNPQQSAHLYIAATLATDQELQPVTVHFEDLNGDGKLDMLVVVGDSLQVPFYNNGTSFQSQPPGR